MAAGLEQIGHGARPIAVTGTLVLPTPAFHYREQPPPSELAAPIASLWRSRVGGAAQHRLRLVPDGCVELSRSDDGETVLFGPATSWSDLALQPGRSFVGLRLRPGAAGALLGGGVRESVGLVLDAADLAPLLPLARAPLDRWLSTALALVEDRRFAYPRRRGVGLPGYRRCWLTGSAGTTARWPCSPTTTVSPTRPT